MKVLTAFGTRTEAIEMALLGNTLEAEAGIVVAQISCREFAELPSLIQLHQVVVDAVGALNDWDKGNADVGSFRCPEIPSLHSSNKPLVNKKPEALS